MKRPNQNQILRSISVLLCAALVLALALSAAGQGRTPPADPLEGRTAEPLRPEAAAVNPNRTDNTTQGQDENQTKPTEPDPTTPTEPDPTDPEDTEPTEPSQPDTPSEDTRPTDGPAEPDPTEPAEPDPTAPSDPGGGDQPDPDQELKIITDLSNRVVTQGQISGDILPFYAYISGGQEGMYLRVNLRNGSTGGNGTYLEANGAQYEAALTMGRNYFTLYIKQGNKTVYQIGFVITYAAEKADRDHPDVGEHPPTIVTNLDGFTGVLENQNFTFTVTARTYQGSVIFSNNIQVMMDGKLQSGPTGSSVFEYQLYFDQPVSGEYEDHLITVLAWDQEGNSAYREYTVRFHFIDRGGEIGTATLILDATTAGVDGGWLDEPYTFTIRQGEPAAYAILEMLEANGYTVLYGGTPDEGFYLRRLTRGGMMDGAQIPEELWQKVLDDGLSLTGQSSRDSLGEFDYTMGSGWMYSVGGQLYPGKGMSSYYLSDGDVLYIRFTLSYGKDIAGFDASGGSYGTLSSYCGLWLNGEYIPQHQLDAGTKTREPDCTQPGEMTYSCTVRGCRYTETQPVGEALGHDYHETARQEPTETEDGFVEETCGRCGDVRRQTLPKTGPDPTDPQPTDPMPTDPVPTDPPEDPSPTDPQSASGGTNGDAALQEKTAWVRREALHIRKEKEDNHE